MRNCLAILLAINLLASGCAHHRLQRNTVLQSHTIADIQEQQVLDNLAMFIDNPGATPFFALPSGGSTTVSQKNSLLNELSYNTTRFTGLKSIPGGEYGLQENWTLKPINEPERLELMKCLYQRVTGQDQGIACQDCDHKLKNYFRNEIEACPIPTCFYQIGNKRPPRRRDCHIKFGHYRNTYVCVTSENFEALSRLTIAILDIATVTTSDLAKRVSHEKSIPKVQLMESFIANIDGTSRLVQASYALSVDDFRKVQTDGAVSPGSIEKLLSHPPSSNEPENKEGVKMNDLKILPTTSESTGKSRRETGGSLESLLHSSNAASQLK